jgi:hypothetical protein
MQQQLQTGLTVGQGSWEMVALVELEDTRQVLLRGFLALMQLAMALVAVVGVR